MNKEPLLIFQKNADKRLNRIMLPKAVVKKWGYAYYLEVYKDKMILKPVEKK